MKAFGFVLQGMAYGLAFVQDKKAFGRDKKASGFAQDKAFVLVQDMEAYVLVLGKVALIVDLDKEFDLADKFKEKQYCQIDILYSRNVTHIWIHHLSF